MKISLNWLNEYIDLKDVSLDEILDKLTYAGLEVEEVDDQAANFKNIIAGYVVEAKKHPNADKLSLCKVSDGNEEFNVVCGAPNVATGQKIVFAKVGAVIPNGKFKIEKAKIRGEVSSGMICSERELNISENHEGIMVLDPSVKEGTPVSDILGLNDVIMEIAITPNRADALSHIGIARDLSALFNRPLKYPEINLSESDKKSSDLASVEIIDAVNCPRYIGKVVIDVQIKESPEWLKKRIRSIGSRPINNVVDVTNFILHEVGQPLHAFDLDKLSGNKIVVRSAGNDLKFTTLDSKERTLRPEDLMICDSKIPVAIAGVMGGENSEVTQSTKNILIESAFFNPSSVRKTAKQLGLSTDASYRFERGTDPEITVWAAQRAAGLIQETGGGQILSGEIDAYPLKLKRKETGLRFARIDKILGYHIDEKDVMAILERLGFEIKKKTDDGLTAVIPLYRHDVEREIDLIEEIARIYGYNKIPEVSKISVTLEEKVDHSAFVDKVRVVLNSLGFYEIITNSLLSDETANRFGKPVHVLNPQSSEMSHLRPSLLPGMLTTISNNLKVNEKDLQLFETGKTFEKISDSKIESFDDFTETEQLLVALTGNAVRTEWYDKDRQQDIFEMKGFVSSFIEVILPKVEFNFIASEEHSQYLEYCLSIKAAGQEIGYCGMIKKEICSLFDINQDVIVFMSDLNILKQVPVPKKSFKELLKFPKVFRDCAFVLDAGIGSERVIEVIKEHGSNLLHNVKLFDIFQSESLGSGKKSLAFQLEYYDFGGTLTEEEIEKIFTKTIKAVEQKFDAKLRGA
ncbi:MAG: phenylalanine--tRNA ligase subunit beta [Ignavibacteriae bacterium HGW-Ignavibacteriae-3]|nr:MAG: phenylalanine--tRNA ligase subunit beta [Ignavibacteriae bacterium HGW-Ignavibacteriae-3]